MEFKPSGVRKGFKKLIYFFQTFQPVCQTSYKEYESRFSSVLLKHSKSVTSN